MYSLLNSNLSNNASDELRLEVENNCLKINQKLEELSKQGAAGRQKINNSTRALTVLLAAVQGYGIIVTMENQYGLTSLILLNHTSFSSALL